MTESNAYTAMSLAIAFRSTVTVTVLPFMCMVLLSMEEFSNTEFFLYAALSMVVSVIALVYLPIFCALFQAIRNFRLSFLFFYFSFSFLFPSLFYLFGSNNLANLLLTLLVPFAFFTLVFLFSKFFTHNYMQLAGWVTSDEAVLNPNPEGSLIGNKLAVALGIMLVCVIGVVIAIA